MNMRIGISPCPNDVFIFSGWLLGRTPAPAADFFFGDVETLNAAARRAGGGEYDLVKVSYANVPDCAGYGLLACGGALGRGCGPLLLTGGGAWDPAAEVLVPGARTTANFLLDFWHEAAQGGDAAAAPPLRKRFLPFDELYRALKADPRAQGVVIHEMRFTYARDGLKLVRDLGAHWEAATGKPIPLGALLRRESPRLPSLEELETAVRASLDWAWSHRDEALRLCALHAQDMTPEVMQAHVDLYVNGFTRDLGEEGRDAVRTLLARLGTR
jgi:1,4-dihydroxy-6-naphthoate synthase